MLLIPHYSLEGDVLSYNVMTGSCQRVHSRRLQRGRTLDRGAFVVIKGHFYGVIASESGPVFFQDAKRTPLIYGAHQAQVTRDGAAYRFSLIEDGSELLAVRYQRTEPSYTTPYDQDVEDSDFFTSLQRSMATTHFFTWHTIAPIEKML